MSIEVIDLVDLAHKEKRRKNVFNTPRFHAWMHYYKPGHKDEMHCHNADQTFYVIDGECTMRFPNDGEAVLKPGKAALITGGSFYQLENTGLRPMIMMGNRWTVLGRSLGGNGLLSHGTLICGRVFSHYRN